MTDTSPRVFSAFLEIREGGKADGKRLSELIELTHQGMRVEGVRRSDNVQIVPLPDAVIRAGDRLFVVDTPNRLKEFEGALGRITSYNVCYTKLLRAIFTFFPVFFC